MRDFSILPPVDDSVLFQIVPALQTVPQVPRVPNQAPKLQNSNFPTHKCEPSLTGQGFLGAIIPCTAGNRISRGEPQTPASNYSLLPTSATPNIDVDSWKWHHSRENHGPLAVASARENRQPQPAANESCVASILLTMDHWQWHQTQSVHGISDMT
jgi:hypothetical protein